eukprot:6196999-Pleurochrysis_carterae.AAC.2
MVTAGPTGVVTTFVASAPPTAPAAQRWPRTASACAPADAAAAGCAHRALQPLLSQYTPFLC